jgi:hypothetical protein
MSRGLALACLLATAGCFAAACSSAPKRAPELGKLAGRKVALVEVEGEPTARRVVEVALVNQLLRRGTFELLSRQDVENARTEAGQDPTDWRGIARRAGADWALRAEVVRFSAEEHQGYSSQQVEDGQLAAERGEADRRTERVFKVRSLEGDVGIGLTFAELKTGELRQAVAEARDRAVSDETGAGAPRLPPRLRFLERLTEEAFRRFFDQYN